MSALKVFGRYRCKSQMLLGAQGRFEWQKCLSKRKKQINYLVKFLLSCRRDAVDFCIMNTGFLVVLTTHFLLFLFQFVVAESLLSPQQLHMVTKEQQVAGWGVGAGEAAGAWNGSVGYISDS